MSASHRKHVNNQGFFPLILLLERIYEGVIRKGEFIINVNTGKKLKVCWRQSGSYLLCTHIYIYIFIVILLCLLDVFICFPCILVWNFDTFLIMHWDFC